MIEFCAAKGIQRPYWPPRSPDMNPIEYVWGWVKDKLFKLRAKPRNLPALKEILTKIWYEIPQDNIRNLYRGMPNRIQSLLAANGQNTKHKNIKQPPFDKLFFYPVFFGEPPLEFWLAMAKRPCVMEDWR